MALVDDVPCNSVKFLHLCATRSLSRHHSGIESEIFLIEKVFKHPLTTGSYNTHGSHLLLYFREVFT